MAKKTTVQRYSPADQTLKMLTTHIVDTLDHAAVSDETIGRLNNECYDIEIDTRALNVYTLMSSPAVQAAFEKFVTNMVSNCQMLEEELDITD